MRSVERGARANENIVLEGGGLCDPTSVGEGNETFFIRMWKLLHSKCVLKNLRKPKRENSKKTISASGGLEPLQMVREPGTEWCANKDIGPRKRVVWEIPHRLKRGMKYFL